jgi:hypothetical protein
VEARELTELLPSNKRLVTEGLIALSNEDVAWNISEVSHTKKVLKFHLMYHILKRRVNENTPRCTLLQTRAVLIFLLLSG